MSSSIHNFKMLPIMKPIVIINLLVILYPSQVTPHGNGAPANRCDSMEPGHWVSPQEILSPYQVLIDKTVITPGERVNITLRTIRGQTGFKGFFIMVKEGDNDEHAEGGTEDQRKNEAYGEFDLAKSDIKHAQPVHCFNLRNSAMTHLMNDVKNTVELTWIAPKLITEQQLRRHSNPYMDRELKVVATFVKDFWTVWTNVEPVGGVRLLLTDTHQPLSPKFQQPQVINHKLGGGHPEVLTTSSSSSSSSSISEKGSSDDDDRATSDSIPLEESNSWAHFKRAWNFMVGIFGSSPSSSSQATSFS